MKCSALGTRPTGDSERLWRRSIGISRSPIPTRSVREQGLEASSRPCMMVNGMGHFRAVGSRKVTKNVSYSEVYERSQAKFAKRCLWPRNSESRSPSKMSGTSFSSARSRPRVS